MTRITLSWLPGSERKVDPMEHHDFAMHHGGHGFFGWFLLFLVVALLIGLIVAYATRLLGSHSPAAAGTAPRTGDDPVELLRLRYARGEIDRDTFVQTNADLGGPAPPA